ncbi:MAG TPA: ROK family protein [Bacteroidales bacterium]|nr:ROK family protein [Bacteroidales bacterium]
MKFKKILGIDIGGSGIKGAPVNTKNGKLLAKRHRIETPIPATPLAVAEVIKAIAKHFKWEGPIGCGFPAVVLNGVVKTATNIDKSWIETDARELFTRATGLPTWVINDADAAGLAAVRFGAGKKSKGSVLMLTIGTGIGSAFFTRGKLLPNTELGHLILNGQNAEKYTSDATRKAENLSWEEWGKRFNEYLMEMERLFWPELVIIGGGMSRKMDKFVNQLTLKTKVVPELLQNDAGIIGSALSVRANRDEVMNGYQSLKI